MAKGDLLNRIRSDRARLDEVLSRIPEDSMATQPADAGAWSAKDQLAHLSAWHRVALARVLGRSEGEVFGWPEGSYEDLDIDQLNARFHAQFGGRPLDEVRSEFSASYDQLLGAIEGMNDADLDRHWLSGNPDRGTYGQMIAANTFEHYDEHLPALNALTDR